MPDQQLAEKSHKPAIKKLKKRNVHSVFLDNPWGADLADMQLIKLNKENRFKLWVIIQFKLFLLNDILSKCKCIVPLKNKKGTIIINVFQKISDESGLQPNKG